MLFIDNKGITDPRINLAIEEYCVKNLDINETYLLFTLTNLLLSLVKPKYSRRN